MDLQLTGKRAVVTGGSSGIGLAVADGLAAEGVDVAVVARRKEPLDAAVDQVARHGTRVLAAPADTADDDSVRGMAKQVLDELGGVDILVNAAARPAGLIPQRELADLTDDDVRIELETKLLGYLRCARALSPSMIESGWGRIVNVSGLNARQSVSVVGSVRNIAVAAMSSALADELGPKGINVSVVHPGMTVTTGTEELIASRARQQGIDEATMRARAEAGTRIGRLATAAEVADVIVFLCSPRAVAIAGDTIAAGGGARGVTYY
ncbi:SDR family NAD(P)-dependent oxidoreductase [Pseudonocardia benzenivorans]|jgi:NAD(P)-dependent dehydrogenase (short-subunit alcohol dehydrogenase family)|uniref:3-oxoacyl-(Acyl-carrier-protein) reductase n=2 Tax=Pseudonocardia TaxID=1847 RepID=F4CQL2_PSEUX|nr:SDR family NAD(P)-dependent oxidoreductase [Pseudonocardia dioxanivorans]AEA22804.1 3-oxoacyl-(acyl-carrier-protein) reductase [Pseudonocardia dioxanivorans CB1190]